jgi:hypothetical protein
MLQWLDVNLVPGFMPAAGLAAYAVLVAASGLAVQALTGRDWAGLLAGLIAALSPSAILYSRFWFSTIFCAALIAVFAALVAIGARRRSGSALAAAGLALALAATFHTAFAGVLVVFVAVLLLALARNRSLSRRAALFSLLALAIAFATPLKNWLHFGVFTPSSWGPLNLVTAISGWSGWGECAEEVRRQPPPDPGERRGAVLMTRALTEPDGGANYNHIVILDCARRIDIAAHFEPGPWLANLAHNGYFLLANPSWDYSFLGAANLSALEPLIALADPLRPGGRPSFDHPPGQSRTAFYWSRLSPVTLLVTGLALLTAAASVAHLLLRLARPAIDSEQRFADLAAALIGTVYLAYLALCLVTNGVEMNRLRFAVFPLELCLLAALALSLARWFRSKAG